MLRAKNGLLGETNVRVNCMSSDKESRGPGHKQGLDIGNGKEGPWHSILADITDPCLLVFTPSCNPLLVFTPSHLHLVNRI